MFRKWGKEIWKVGEGMDRINRVGAETVERGRNKCHVNLMCG